MISDWLLAQTALFAVLEPVLLAHGIVTINEHRSDKAFSLASTQSFDLLSELLDHLARLRAEGHATLTMLGRILDQVDDLPNDVARRQKIVMRLVEGVHEEITICGRYLEERLSAWKAGGSPGGPAVGEAMIAEAQNPLKELLTEILQRPEVNLSV
jgi:hypothetical protein